MQDDTTNRVDEAAALQAASKPNSLLTLPEHMFRKLSFIGRFRHVDQVGDLFACLVLCIVLVPRFGLLGAAWATSISFALKGLVAMAIMTQLFFRRQPPTETDADDDSLEEQVQG